MTRFSAVLGVAVLASALGPADDPGRPEVRDQTVPVPAEALRGGRVTDVATGLDAELVGLTWSGDPAAAFRVRGLVPGSGWSEWLELHGEPGERPDDAGGQGEGEGDARPFAGPAWLGQEVRHVQVRLVEGEVDAVELHAIDSDPPAGGGGLFGVEPAAANVPLPGLIYRHQWGADESWRTLNCDGKPEYATDVRFAVVHHTVNSNSYTAADSAALIRGIYHFHTHTNGWCDIAYNFLVDRHGQMFEGRAGGIGKPVIGGHAGGFNSGSTGVAVLGDFSTGSVPTAAYAALRDLLAWKLAYHGVNPTGTTVEVTGNHTSPRWAPGTVVTLPNIEGHRDSNRTDCPGANLYALLPQLRTDVKRIVDAWRDDRLVCDWDGDGDDTPAWYQDGYWYIRNASSEGFSQLTIHYGGRGYIPVCGDWDGDGTDTIGVYNGGTWLLRNSNGPGPPDVQFAYGVAGWRPLVGDWDGNGSDGIGVYVDGRWLLRHGASAGQPDTVFDFGVAAYTPIVGDWDGQGGDGIGIFVAGSFRLRQTATPGPAQVAFDGYGLASDRPLAGDWDGDGDDSIGVSRGSYWWLRDHLTSGAANRVFPF